MSKHLITIKPLETLSGHYYKVNNKIYPSVTTILTSFPQSVQLTEWIANTGWHESQKIKSEAGEKGTAVHKAIGMLLAGNKVYKEHYGLEEWWKLNVFKDWYEKEKPKIVAIEKFVYSKKYGYAGTVDFIYKNKEGQLILADFKTSKSIYDHFPLQVSAYALAYEEQNKKQKIFQTAILQLGAKNKDGYRFITYGTDEWLQEHFPAFLSIKTTYEYQHGKDYVPQVFELPAELKL